MATKINTLDDVQSEIKRFKSEGKRIVLCHGVFDLLHIGHIRYLRQAKTHGDILIVTLTPDRYVDKGPGRPAFTEQLRAEALASLNCVNFVVINQWATAEETLRFLRPDVYVKGSEFKDLNDVTGKIAAEAKVCEQEGITLTFVEDIVFSSSNLINRYLSAHSNDCQEYLELFRTRHSTEDIFRYLDSFSDLTVLVVGDTILDEYIYCRPLGASSKDPVLALLHQSQELFVGGAAAVANHVAQHARKVILCTVIGNDGYDDFIQTKLSPRVELRYIKRAEIPTVRKVRILDGYSSQKQLEIYHMSHECMNVEQENQFAELIADAMQEVDLVMAADFGHGCITEHHVDMLCKKAPFLAVNTQANAGNRGYHTIDRYARADFISLASHELSLQFRNRNASTGHMLSELVKLLECNYVLVTEGKKGCALWGKGDFLRAPSFASREVDRVGAGDALFSITSLAAFKKLPLDVTAFLGNVVGSLAIEVMGNAKSVSRESIKRYITTVLK